MKKLLLVALSLVICSLNTLCFADVFKATGTAPIINGNIAEARKQAIQDALRQALMQSGADVSFDQNMKNGRLTIQHLRVKSDSTIRRYNILEQKKKGNYLEVTVSADIYNKKGVCNGKNYAKSITVLRFFYDDGQLQQSQFQLSDINKELSRQIYSRMMNNHQIFRTEPWLDRSYRLDMRSLEAPNADLKKQLRQLAKDTDSQYLVAGSIRDISFRPNEGNALTKWFKNDIRTMSLSIYLINGFTGEMVLARNYSTQAEWEFDKKEQISVRSNQFWDSVYGHKVAELLDAAVGEISREIMCKPLQATIIRAQNGQYYINAGSGNNIRKGDTFTIALSGNYQDTTGRERLSSSTVTGTYTVDQVFADGALLVPNSKTYPDSNIQNGDLAISQ